MCYLPLIFANNILWNCQQYLLVYGILWIGTESLWNVSAYYLEFEGINSFNYIWYSSILFFSVNVYIMLAFLQG